jgi:hypothetical protein
MLGAAAQEPPDVMGIALAALRALDFRLQEGFSMPPISPLAYRAESQAAHDPLQRTAGWLRALKRYDDQRPSVPGEHWFAFGTGAALLLRGRRADSPLLRTAATLGGLLFMARGLSGRDGLVAKLRRR